MDELRGNLEVEKADAGAGIRTRAVSLEGTPLKKVFHPQKQLSNRELEEYLTLLEIQGLSEGWIYRVKRALIKYLDSIGWEITKPKTLDYLKQRKNELKTSSFRKDTYQILKLLGYLKMPWAGDIQPPAEPHYTPKRVGKEDILETIEYFRNDKYFKRFKALVLLGATSGMRAEELYQLTPDDIDIEERMIRVNHDPDNGQTTKTKQSRITFFNTEAQQALVEYLDFFNNGSELEKLFSKFPMERAFKDAPIYVKDLRKFFSQQWDRQGGATSIKKVLMGHSLNGDVDLTHYNSQSERDLKGIYDDVGIKITM
ncbi:MAG: tyrosine-type recombinase/integrase [Thermoplasmatota archaeon]